jgi:hypothetical protein
MLGFESGVVHSASITPEAVCKPESGRPRVRLPPTIPRPTTVVDDDGAEVRLPSIYQGHACLTEILAELLLAEAAQPAYLIVVHHGPTRCEGGKNSLQKGQSVWIDGR